MEIVDNDDDIPATISTGYFLMPIRTVLDIYEQISEEEKDNYYLKMTHGTLLMVDRNGNTPSTVSIFKPKEDKE